jgi:ABC-2 type transport system ATP-binding protein
MAFTTPPLSADTDVVGTPVLDVRLRAPAFRKSQDAGPSGQLILFAKIYDVSPDGTQVLPNRIVAPVRVPDVSQRLQISFPTLVYRFQAGHRLRMVLAQGDLSYSNNTIDSTVKIINGSGHANALTLPVVNK